MAISTDLTGAIWTVRKNSTGSRRLCEGQRNMGLGDQHLCCDAPSVVIFAKFLPMSGCYLNGLPVPIFRRDGGRREVGREEESGAATDSGLFQSSTTGDKDDVERPSTGEIKPKPSSSSVKSQIISVTPQGLPSTSGHDERTDLDMAPIPLYSCNLLTLGYHSTSEVEVMPDGGNESACDQERGGVGHL